MTSKILNKWLVHRYIDDYNMYTNNDIVQWWTEYMYRVYVQSICTTNYRYILLIIVQWWIESNEYNLMNRV